MTDEPLKIDRALAEAALLHVACGRFPGRTLRVEWPEGAEHADERSMSPRERVDQDTRTTERGDA